MNRIEFREDFLYLWGKINQCGGNPCRPYNPNRGELNSTSIWWYPALRTLFEMASKKKKPTQYNGRNVEFVNYKFDKPTKEAFDAWFAAKGNSAINAVFETLQSEHKLSLSYDTESEVFIAAMTGKEDSLNPGKCLTLRSTEWFKAMAACAYVHTVIFSGEVWEIEAGTDVL